MMDTLQKAGLLQLLPNIKKIDAVQCMWAFNKAYGVKIDWHEFGWYLDELHTKGILKVTQGTGMTQYVLNQEQD